VESGASQSTRSDYDQALKHLLLRAHDGFLAPIFPGVAWRGERSSERPAVTRRADLVWEVEGSGQRGLLHIELQAKVEEDVGERVAEYAIRLWRRDHLPVESVVVFLRPSTNLPASRFALPGLGRERMIDTHTSVRLWEVPAERALDADEPALWPLAALMAGTTVERTVEVATRIADTAAPLEERRELTGLLVTLNGLRLPRSELFAAVRGNAMINELLRESSVAEEFIEQGREEGLRDAVRLLLESRFATLDQRVLETLARADRATLEQVLLHAATDTLEQLRSRLGLG
jgi:hypothetical protein